MRKSRRGKRRRRTIATWVISLIAMDANAAYTANPGLREFAIKDRNGKELARYDESPGDGENYLHERIAKDLQAMSAAEFAATWIDE